MVSVTMILLAALLCNYGRGFCLIDVGTEGNTAGDVTSVVVNLRDITTERESQEATRRSTAELEAVFDAIHDAIVVFDPMGNVTRINEAATKLLGVHSQDNLQTQALWIAEIFQLKKADGSSVPSDDGPVAQALRGGEYANLEFWGIRPDNHGRACFRFSGAPVRDATGRQFLAVVVIQDVTDQKLLEQNLASANQRLRESNQDLQRFATIAAHDLREPLRTITSLTQLITHRNKQFFDEESNRFARHIVTGVDRLDALLTDLMQFAAVSAPAELHDVDSGLALGLALQHLQFKIDESAAQVTFDRLPMVHSHETLLLQVFQNLIGNAIKYCDGKPQVHISAVLSGREWIFSVRDNGIGIAPQYQQDVFGFFKRLHSKAEYPGTGLGLAICKRAIAKSGGRVWVESEGEGKGSTFFFTLPA